MTKSGAGHLDLIAVDKACSGDPVALSISERREAVRRLTAHDYSIRDIAARLHVSPRTVVRAREAIRTGGGEAA